MDTKMDAELIKNEERQGVEEATEEATEAPQPVQQGPPSYVGYPNGSTQPQGMYHVSQPQQPTYIIQNIPAQQSSGCCTGKSDWFKESVGMTTGIVQLIIAIVASILSGVAIWLQVRADIYVGPMGTPIGATLFIFLPAGILGACSKNKSNCVIVAYLVMSILAAIQAGFVCAVESVLAGFSFHSVCPDIPDYRDYPPFDVHGFEYPEIAVDYACSWERFKCLTAVHALIAILMFAEFIVAILAAATCCGGLNCCCPRQQTQQNRSNAMMYCPQAGVQPLQAQMGTHVVQGTELPMKA
ncbi:uncharacterized protein LOC121426169 [Lytechinus variegatus]|uniref:uncharacterized protein LOC121426169 n=1 Tax=Lytechinus variegatus TaxID=7654 RepID=UPI001BB1DF86|nr:uncharacterized protein LOC121426169 [Lytechinus variegatus]